MYYNIDKLKQTGSLQHRGGNGRPRILDNLSKIHNKSVSISTISRHLHKFGYKNVLPKSNHMLTSNENERRVQWAKKHKNDDFTDTIFQDESSFQLFRNTVRRWTKILIKN
ncbi:unnamed protein product [Rotaria magnacalcarata]|uniref:Transposase Tc1-like domain-containing protein n=1 Tax=Rotaria magnacalcarata TaxID=392030 RepID=A0A819PN37_9BILA|nr:unnamed protein product [Rotaria magnacalcarata]